MKFEPLIYHVVARRLSRLKRHVFRIKLAQCVGDVAKLFEDVFDWLLEKLNSLMLLPSLMAVWVAPRHFFRRLPLIQRAHRSWYVKPGFFLLHLAAVTLAITFFVYPRIPGIAAFGGFLGRYVPPPLAHLWTTKQYLMSEGLLLGFCFLAGFWVIPVSAVTLGVRRFIEGALRNANDLQTTYELSKPAHHNPVFLIPLSGESYKLLDWNRYIRALCYFGLSGFLMLHVVGLVAAVSYIALKHFLEGVHHLLYLPTFVLVPFLVGPAIFADALIIRPYVEILRSARKIPTREMYLGDSEEMRFSISLLVAELADLVRLNTYLADFGKDSYPATRERKVTLEKESDQRLVEISATIRDLLQKWSDLKNLWRMQDFDFRDLLPALRSIFFEQRRQVLLETLELARLQNLLMQANVNRIDALCIASVIREVGERLA